MKGIRKGGLQRECIVWEDLEGVRVSFVEVLRDQSGVGNVYPSGWVVNGGEAVMVVAIWILGCGNDS
jgi:hypothetical protein